MKLLRYLITICIMLFMMITALIIPTTTLPNISPGSAFYTAEKECYKMIVNANEMYHLPLNQNTPISPKLRTAVLTFEDRWYHWHFGINPVAIIRAIRFNRRSNKRIGASTITMQVARLAQPKPRTIRNKLLEMIQAVVLEWRYSKSYLFRRYLDAAPYGSNIIGVATAAEMFWGKDVSELSWSEAACLAVIPHAPGEVSPLVGHDNLKRKKNQLLTQIKNRGLMDTETYKNAIAEPVPTGLVKRPWLAPHFTHFVLQNSLKRNGRFQTTLSAPIQQTCETVLKRQREGIREVSHGAIVVLDRKSGAIRSWVGSPSYWDESSAGQIDGVAIKRSSGSTLKPFLYALAFDRGVVLPDTIIHDIPTIIGGYKPINADLEFRGWVQAKNALKYSYNVPAIRTLNRMGSSDFYSWLVQLDGIKLKPLQHYGLTIAVGGIEAPLIEITNAYRLFKNKGNYSGWYMIDQEGPLPTTNVLSHTAAELTSDILRDVTRPGADAFWKHFQNQQDISWKTGTSIGHRDAWAIGVSSDWAVGVWVGNANGQMHPELIGQKKAGPILFDIFRSLRPYETTLPESKPLTDSDFVQLCDLTGYRAQTYCPEKKLARKPKKAPILPSCLVHKRQWVDTRTGFEVCSKCWDPLHMKGMVAEKIPAQVRSYWRKKGWVQRPHRVHSPLCTRPTQTQVQAPRIVYPEKGMTLSVSTQKRPIILRAVTAKEKQNLHWFINGAYIGKSTQFHNQSIQLEKGDYQLEIVNELGIGDIVSFKCI